MAVDPRKTQAHYLRPNERTRTPVRVVCIDTETRWKATPTGSTHTFRLAVSSLDVRRATSRAGERTEWAEHDTKQSLWEWVTKCTTANHATWLYAHNLEFDLTTSDAWSILPALGWVMVGRAAGGSAPWVRWRRGDHTLVCADLAGWCRRKLSVIGEWVGVGKLAMPKQEMSQDQWFAYCRRDTEVLRAAILQLMDWVDSDDLGNWSLGSAGQAWRVFRHRFMKDKILVHDNPEVTAMERAAAFGGRREVYAVGKWRRTPIVNLDFRNHYMTTAGRVRLPRRLAGVVYDPTVAQLEGFATTLAIIAEVEVSTTEPVAPVRTSAGVVYPVGEFVTTLCWPEISLLLEVGAKVTVRRAALYLASGLLAPWATWMRDQLHGAGAETNPLRAAVLKSWSRELIGKFGQRSTELRRAGDPDPKRPPVEQYYPAGDRSPTMVVSRDDGVFIADRSGGTENSVPAIFAYVTSAARVALWRAITALGAGSVLAVDTDGLIALQAPVSALLVPAPNGRLTGAGDAWETGSTWRPRGHPHFPGVLAVKDVWDQLEIRSPEAMIVNGHPRVAGVPRSASRVDAWEFQGELWPGADWQTDHRGAFDYVTVVRRSKITHGYTRRNVHLDGSTTPWVSSLVDGRNVIPELGLL